MIPENQKQRKSHENFDNLMDDNPVTFRKQKSSDDRNSKEKITNLG